MSDSIEKTYVYSNVEVKMTGRNATKELKSGKTDALVEVTPVNSIDGLWKKWVRVAELFEVN